MSCSHATRCQAAVAALPLAVHSPLATAAWVARATWRAARASRAVLCWPPTSPTSSVRRACRACPAPSATHATNATRVPSCAGAAATGSAGGSLSVSRALCSCVGLQRRCDGERYGEVGLGQRPVRSPLTVRRSSCFLCLVHVDSTLDSKHGCKGGLTTPNHVHGGLISTTDRQTTA